MCVCVCVCVCACVWFVAMKSLCALCVCVVVDCQFVRAYTSKCWVLASLCLVKCMCVFVCVSLRVHQCVCASMCVCVCACSLPPISCVGFFSRHSTMHGIPAGTVFSPPWKSKRQAARLSISLRLSSASPLDLSALTACGSISKHEDSQDRGEILQTIFTLTSE